MTDLRRCRVRGCAYLTRRPSGLCPPHEHDTTHLGVADPDQTRPGRPDDAPDPEPEAA